MTTNKMNRLALALGGAFLIAFVGAEPVFAKRGSEVIEETRFLGNSNNVADPDQGGQGATTETTTQTGPPGQIKQDRNDDDCHNCDTSTTKDKPGRNR